MKKSSVVAVAAMVLAVGTAGAQVNTTHPGYYPIEQMGVLNPSDLELDVDLQGAMLKVAAGAMQQQEGEDADLAQLVSGLERVRVLAGEPRGAEMSTIAHTFDQAASSLESAGWSRIVKVVDEGEQIFVFALERAGRIIGLTALINDEQEEIVLVNIVGDIDPVVLGKILARGDKLADLEKLVATGE